MRKLNRCVCAASTAALLTAATGLIGGCGAGGRSAIGLSEPTLSKSRNTGQLTLSIKWPTRTVTQTRVIPAATTDIQLVVTSQSGIFTSTGTNTFTSPPISYGTATFTVSNVPAGSATVSASAVLQQSSGTIVLATVSPTSTTVVAQQSTPLNLTLTATLTVSTTAITTTIQKVLNPDGSAVSATDPARLPQSLSAATFNSPFETLQDQAVYEVVSSIAETSASGTSTTLALPNASEFSFDIENDYDLKGAATPFLTAVDATGTPLSVRPAVGNVAYFKVSTAGLDGELYIPLNATLFSDPNSYAAPYAVYYLAAPGFTP